MTNMVPHPMVLRQVLGIGDFYCTLAVVAHAILPESMLIWGSAYLLAKGGIFALMGNVVSMLDMLCGLYILSVAFGFYNPFLTTFVVIFLFQKACLSLI